MTMLFGPPANHKAVYVDWLRGRRREARATARGRRRQARTTARGHSRQARAAARSSVDDNAWLDLPDGAHQVAQELARITRRDSSIYCIMFQDVGNSRKAINPK